MPIQRIIAVNEKVAIIADLDDFIKDFIRSGRPAPQELLDAKARGETEKTQQISPEEALLRAAAIRQHIDHNSDMANQLVKAANAAHKLMTGREYSPAEIKDITRSVKLDVFASR